MNLALISFILFLFLIPGFSLFGILHSGRWSRKYTRNSLYSYLSEAIYPSFAYHLLAILIINYFLWFIPNVSVEAIFELIIRDKNSTPISTIVNDNIKNFVHLIIFYLLTSGIVGGFLGYHLRKYRLNNHHSPFWRFDNEWYYALTGQVFSWQSFLKHQKYAQLISNKYTVYADILTDTGSHEGSTIYSGYIAEFFLDKDGLDNIYLDSVSRKNFKNKVDTVTENKKGIKESVPPHVSEATSFLVLKSEHIFNIRISLQPEVLRYSNDKISEEEKKMLGSNEIVMFPESTNDSPESSSSEDQKKI